MASAMHRLAIFLQAFIAAAIFVVWGLRHSSVAEELKQDRLPNCKLPSWLRDFLAILKIIGAILLLIGINRPRAAIFGGLMVAVLMAAVVFTHMRVKNPPPKMLLAAMLLVCSLATVYLNYRLNFSM
jgi:DoxX-like family